MCFFLLLFYPTVNCHRVVGQWCGSSPGSSRLYQHDQHSWRSWEWLKCLKATPSVSFILMVCMVTGLFDGKQQIKKERTQRTFRGYTSEQASPIAASLHSFYVSHHILFCGEGAHYDDQGVLVCAVVLAALPLLHHIMTFRCTSPYSVSKARTGKHTKNHVLCIKLKYLQHKHRSRDNVEG